MLTESRKQDLKNLVHDLNALYTETDIEELNNIEAEIQSNLLSILK